MQAFLSFFLIILAIGLGIMAAAHFFIYVSVINFFSLTNTKVKLIIGIILSLLTVSFILSSILVRWQDNIFTKQFYFITGLWLGLLTYLTLFFACSWIASNIFPNIPRLLLGILSIILAIIISGYGVWSAYHPRMINLNISIKNLPLNWQNKTIVQISDVHLGNVLGKDFLTQVVKQINSVNPDLVVITGDLLDGMGDDLTHSVLPINEIKAQYGAYFVTGNHETYLGEKEYDQAINQTNIKILNDRMVELDGLQLLGIAYAPQGQKINLVEKIKNSDLDITKPSVLLYHSPVQIKEASNAGIDLMLAGHTHGGQFFPYNFFTWLIYGACAHGYHRIGNLQIYTSNGTGSWGPTMRIWAKPEIVVIKLVTE